MPDKYLEHDAAGGFNEVEAAAVGGAPSANAIAALDGSGRLDATMMPTGIGAETVDLPAFGALSAGDMVNVYEDAGVIRCRLADASSNVAPAHGFVLAAVLDTATATVYFNGLNDQLTGLTPGMQYVSTTPGATSITAPAVAGNSVQKVGFAVNSTTIMVALGEPIILA